MSGTTPTYTKVEVPRTPILIRVPIQSCQTTKLKLNVRLWNARSLINKISAVSSSILDNKLDIYVITETWTKTDADPIVGEIHSSLGGYTFLHCPRQGRRGGGAGIVARSSLNVKLRQQQEFTTFQYADASVRSRDQLIQLVAVYRQPCSRKNKSPTNAFLGEFRTLLEDLLFRPGKLLILGDFHFHLEQNTVDALRFRDLLASTDLTQHGREATDEKDHTLDLAITRSAEV